MLSHHNFLYILLIVFLACSNTPHAGNPPAYSLISEVVPDTTPLIFAPDFISFPDRYEFGITISKNGKQIFFGVDPEFDLQTPGVHKIWQTSFINDKWTEPEIFLSHTEFTRNDPMLSNDENRLYFISDQPVEGDMAKDIDLWFVEKEGQEWSDPINLGTPINTEFNEFYSSFTDDGSMYFASNSMSSNNPRNYDIYKAQWEDDRFLEPIALSDSINTQYYEGDVFVAPDESYLIFAAARRGGMGQGDLYISFRSESGEWQEAQNMGAIINSENHELCPYVTPDGRYFMYTSNKELYWVSTKIFDRYK